MIGLTDRKASDLLPLAMSWGRAPKLEVISGCESAGYNPARREYPLVAKEESMTVRLLASEDSPVQNLCLKVNGWGHRGIAKIEIDGVPAKQVRQGVFYDVDGTPALLAFIELEAVQATEINILGAQPD